MCKTNLLVCDGDTVGLASGLDFHKNVRGATGVHDLELYAIMNGIYAPLLHSGVVQVFQGVQDQLSQELSFSNLSSAHWLQPILHVLEVVRSTVVTRMLSHRCVSSCASNLALDHVDGCS